MTTLQLNSELLRQMSYIAEDEGMIKKVIAYIKRLRSQNKVDKKGALSSSPDPTLAKEAAELYGLLGEADINEDELSSIVNDVRQEVYGKGE